MQLSTADGENRLSPKIFWPSAAIGAMLVWFVLRDLDVLGAGSPQGNIQQWMVWLLASAGAAVCVSHALSCRSRTLIIGCGFFAGSLSLAVLLGQRMQLDPPAFLGIGFSDLPRWGMLALLLWAVFLCLFQAMERTEARTPAASPAAKHPIPPVLQWLLWTLLLAAAWLPCFLTYYPGLMTGDSFSCLIRGMGWTPVTNQQPVLYQLWVGLLVQFGSLFGGINRGVGFYSLIQLLLMAGMLGYGLYWLRRRGCQWFYLVLVSAFFIFHPYFSKYAITMWKDILFGGVMLLFALFLADTGKQRGTNLLHWRGAVHLCVLAFCVAFLRNNGLYILVIVGVPLVLWCRRYWKRVLPITLALVIGTAVVQGPVYKALKIPSSPFAESLGIPLQQVARVVAKDGSLTPEQAAYLNKLLPLDKMKAVYYPYSTDKVKFHKNFNNAFLEANKGAFFETWSSMLGPHLKEYVIAFLMETLGYWNPGTTNWVTTDAITSWGNDYGITPINLWQRFFGTNSKVYFDQLALDVQEFPLTTLTTNIGVMAWAAALLLFYIILRRKRWERVLPFLPLAALWLTTVIAAPTFCEFRYMFSFFTTLPFLLPITVPNAFLKRGPQPPEAPCKDTAS